MASIIAAEGVAQALQATVKMLIEDRMLKGSVRAVVFNSLTDIN